MLKITAVKALPDYKLLLTYSDGTTGEVELSYLVGKGVFKAWQDYHFFEKVYIANSRRIAWSEEIELCADALYLKITHKQPEDLFSSLQKEVLHA